MFLMFIYDIQFNKICYFFIQTFLDVSCSPFFSQWAGLGVIKLWHFSPFGDFRGICWLITQICIFQFRSFWDMFQALTGLNSYWKLVKRFRENSYFFSKIHSNVEWQRLENYFLKSKKAFLIKMFHYKIKIWWHIIISVKFCTIQVQ